ncbi:MAG: hypothetical protein M3Y27_12780 [Acidobacteriota bacterium]|nr:hypothetical protein [Acidobacteriota bacterium]
MTSLRGTPRPKLLDKSDAGIELGIPRQSVLQSRHSNQDHANLGSVKDGTHLFEASHSTPVSFIDDDERCWVAESRVFNDVLFGDLTVCWLEFREWLVFNQSCLLLQT